MDNYMLYAVETSLDYCTVIARSYAHVEQIINEERNVPIITIEHLQEQTVCMHHHGIVATLTKED